MDISSIAVQNNAIRTNYVQVKTDNRQQISKCQFCGVRDGTTYQMISKCGKLAQKEYKSRHEWVGEVIHRESCKRLNFDHTTKGYMHKPESILENGTHKILWDFKIQIDHLILARRQDVVLINKNKKI